MGVIPCVMRLRLPLLQRGVLSALTREEVVVTQRNETHAQGRMRRRRMRSKATPTSPACVDTYYSFPSPLCPLPSPSISHLLCVLSSPLLSSSHLSYRRLSSDSPSVEMVSLYVSLFTLYLTSPLSLSLIPSHPFLSPLLIHHAGSNLF